MSMLTSRYLLASLFLATLFAASCANPVAPSGGKKDTIAPKILSSTPANRSINFTGKKIILEFDEFVQLNNPSSQIVISPPLNEFPDITLKGKAVVVTFKEILKENTTYTINFGEAIKDITENNPSKEPPFVFSTGTEIDSQQVKGMVLDAQKSQTLEDVLVMLYKDLTDSVPIKSKPYYFGRTDKSGRFLINNVKEGTYKLFALKDANYNLLYDLPTESVAFSDTNIVVGADSSKQHDYRLMLFQQVQNKTFLVETDGKQREKIKYTYSKPINNFRVMGMGDSTPVIGTRIEYNATRDTIFQWVTSSSRNPRIKIAANDSILDTVNLRREAFSSDSIKSNNKLTITTSITSRAGGGKQSLYSPFTIELNRPLAMVDSSLIQLTADTVAKRNIPIAFEYADSVHRKINIYAPWAEDTWYKLTIKKGAVTDIYNKVNDSSVYTFRTPTNEDYGTLTLALSHLNPGVQYILTLTQDNGKLIKTEYIDAKTSEQLVYKHLDGAGYNLKIIHDSNHNGKWDSGNYSQKQQPEKIYMHPSAIMVKGNWDIKQEIDLKQ